MGERVYCGVGEIDGNVVIPAGWERKEGERGMRLIDAEERGIKVIKGECMQAKDGVCCYPRCTGKVEIGMVGDKLLVLMVLWSKLQ